MSLYFFLIIWELFVRPKYIRGFLSMEENDWNLFLFTSHTIVYLIAAMITNALTLLIFSTDLAIPRLIVSVINKKIHKNFIMA